MKFRVTAIILYIISAILMVGVLAAVASYFMEYQPGQPKHAEASDLIEGIYGILVISAMFFFLGRIFLRKWKHDKAVRKAI